MRKSSIASAATATEARIATCSDRNVRPVMSPRRGGSPASSIHRPARPNAHNAIKRRQATTWGIFRWCRAASLAFTTPKSANAIYVIRRLPGMTFGALASISTIDEGALRLRSGTFGHRRARPLSPCRCSPALLLPDNAIDLERHRQRVIRQNARGEISSRSARGYSC